MNTDDIVIAIEEEKETYSDDSLYNITSFGADLSFREIVSMYKEGDLEKPELQRKYVWTKAEASRFIDSILLGLPVPSIFLAKTDDDRRLIVDGYQRIMTVFDYIEGVFSGDGKVFRLSNTESIHPNWRGKAYSELSDDQRRRIRTSSIHAIVFEQKHPQNDTGMYQVFERINTSGRPLKPQEIRNCVYQGKFNSFLFDLNRESVWRSILESEIEDNRMADIELILRFFAFICILERNEMKQKQINLVKYLNDYMSEQSAVTKDDLNEKHNLFIETMSYLHARLGSHAFRNISINNETINWVTKINPVIFDSVSAATVLAGDAIKDADSLHDNYIKLLMDEEYKKVTSQRTTDTLNIRKRIEIASRVLYGVDI